MCQFQKSLNLEVEEGWRLADPDHDVETLSVKVCGVHCRGQGGVGAGEVN